jgi:hypothetical protein
LEQRRKSGIQATKEVHRPKAKGKRRETLQNRFGFKNSIMVIALHYRLSKKGSQPDTPSAALFNVILHMQLLAVFGLAACVKHTSALTTTKDEDFFSF